MWTDFEIDKLNKLTEKYKVITCVIGALNLYDFRIFQMTFFNVWIIINISEQELMQ